MIKALLLVFVFLSPVTSLHGQEKKDEIVFLGMVTKLSSAAVTVSGDILIYRLVKYRIEKVIIGEYSARTIVVDHLVLTGRELDKVKVGDKFKVTVRRVKSVEVRTNSPGIRKPSEVVKEFFVAEKFDKQK